MTQKKIFITGSGGFIGRNLVENLSDRYEVLSPRSSELDLADQRAVDNFFIRKKFDAVVHCAVKPGHRNVKDAGGQLYTNLQMFSNVMKHRDKFNKFIFLGSGLSYDIRHYQPKMTEDYFGTHIPADEGGFSKYLISKFISTDLNMVDLRVFGIFGKHEDYAIRFISNMICKCLFGLPLTMNQNRKFDYISIEDLPKIVEYFIENEVKFRAYNVTPDKSIDLYSIAEIVRNICGKENLPIVVAEPGMGVEYSGDNSRLRSEIKNLGFTPLDQAIERLVGWYRDHLGEINKNSLVVDR